MFPIDSKNFNSIFQARLIYEPSEEQAVGFGSQDGSDENSEENFISILSKS